MVRVRSTQKFPIVRWPRRVMPRMIATTTAMPAAAETKFWTVKPSIWVRWLIVLSPPYHCQFVLVMKLTATLNAPSGATPGTGRVERQLLLDALQQVDGEERHEAEGEQGDGVDVPPLLALGVDPQEAVDHSLDRTEDAIARRAAVVTSAVDRRQVPAERRCGDGQHDEQQDELEEAGTGHQNFSGRTSTTMR